jgi:hypothetical protein
MSIPRAHHYLPQFYLRGFSRENRLWVYDRYKNEYRNQTPKNIAVERDYYTVTDEKGEKKTDIEKFFSVIEGKASPVIQNVNARNYISTMERDILSIFVSFLKVRVPDFEKSNDEYNEKIIKWMNKFMFCDEYHTKVMLDNYERDTGEKLDIEPDELMRFIHEDEYRIKVNKNFTLGLMLDLGIETAHYLRQMDWLFIYAPKEASFVTTDNPFSLIPPLEYNKFWGVGLLTKGTVKYVPLTQRVAVLIKDKGDKIEGGNPNRDFVKRLNYRVAADSDRLVIARDEPLLRKIVKVTQINTWKKESRVTVS